MLQVGEVEGVEVAGSCENVLCGGGGRETDDADQAINKLKGLRRTRRGRTLENVGGGRGVF